MSLLLCTLLLTAPEAVLPALQQDVAARIASLSGALTALRDGGHDIAVPDGALAVAELFLQWSQTDAEQPELVDGAVRSLAYVRAMLDEEIALTARVRKGEASYPRIPQTSVVGVTWREGMFVVGDQPVFLSGFNWDATLVQDDPMMARRLGINLADSVLRGANRPDGTWDDGEYRWRGAFLEHCAKEGFAVDSLLGGDPPKWMQEADPTLVHKGYGHGRDTVFDHPKATEFRHQFLEHFIPLFASKPSLFAIDLVNEPAWQTASPIMMDGWRKWLKDKYGTIAACNQRWGTDFASFEAIESYPSMGDPTKGPWSRGKVDFSQPGVRGMHYDWCAFNNDRVSGYLVDTSKRIRKLAPQVATHVKIMMGNFFTGSTERRGWEMGLTYHTFGIDAERLANGCSLLGCDLDLSDLGNDPEPNRFCGSVPYVINWLNAGLAADFLKSLAPNKPYYNSEFHAVERVDEINAAPSAEEHIRTALWLAHLHGMAADITWYWGRSTDGSIKGNGTQWFQGSLLQQPWTLRGYVQETLKLRNHVRETLAFGQAPRPVRLLYSEASAIQDVGYFDCLRDSYEALNFTGLSIGLLTENQLAAGIPEEVKLLIVPDARYVQDTTVPGLRQAIAAGMKVAVIGEEALACLPTGNPRPDHDVPGALRAELAQPQEYLPVFLDWLQQAGVQPELRVAGEDGQPVWGVETRAIRLGEQRLAYLVNLMRSPVTVRLGQAVHDWRTGRKLSGTVTLQPRELVFGEW